MISAFKPGRLYTHEAFIDVDMLVLKVRETKPTWRLLVNWVNRQYGPVNIVDEVEVHDIRRWSVKDVVWTEERDNPYEEGINCS